MNRSISVCDFRYLSVKVQKIAKSVGREMGQSLSLIRALDGTLPDYYHSITTYHYVGYIHTVRKVSYSKFVFKKRKEAQLKKVLQKKKFKNICLYRFKQFLDTPFLKFLAKSAFNPRASAGAYKLFLAFDVNFLLYKCKIACFTS